MEVSYIILAHKNPYQLKKLIDQLREPWVRFYIHIDKNSDILPFRNILEGEDIYFLNEDQRSPGTWGDIGIVSGTLEALQQIINDGRAGYCVLLSGQDYPLRSNRRIKEFFTLNQGKKFIDVFQLPGIWQQSGLDRIRYYKINKSTTRGHFLQLPTIFDRGFYQFDTAGKINYLRKTRKYKEVLKIFKKREFPDMNPYGGSQWWAIPVDTANKVLEYCRENPSYLNYHKYTLLPDEIFFQSLIMNLDPEFIFPSVTYVNWDKKSGPPPVTFSENDFKELTAAAKEKLFARKFDLYFDKNIFDALDNFISRNK